MLVHLAIAQVQGHVQDPSAEATAEFAAAAPGTAIDWMRRLTAAPAARFWHSGSYQWASRHHEQTRAVLNRAASGEVITIATVGGSSSAQQTNYGHHLATGLRTLLHEAGYLNASIRVINPSQGSSGTDWAAAFMFSLLPPTVDILLWEMAINDWHTADLSKSGMATSLAYQQLAELFLRRALALNPAMVVGFVHLWKVGAASCWPHCDKKGLLVQAQLQVLRAYSFLDLFVLDCSAMFEAFRVPAGWLFEDAHHPSPSAHIAIAGGLLRHMLPFVLQMQHDPSSRDRSGQLAVLPARMPSVAFPPPSAAELDQVLLVRVLQEALLDVSRSIPSISYSLPTFGGNASLLSDEGAGDTGMLLTPDGAVHYENRSDYKREVSLPLCGAAQGTTLRYRVRGAGTQFVGISLRGATKAKHTLLPARPVVGLPHENVSALLRVHIRNALQPESAPPVLLQPLPEELMRAHFPVLIRGTLAPQAWFSVPGIAARAPAPSGPTQVEELVSLCATVGRLMVITAVGGVVFV